MKRIDPKLLIPIVVLFGVTMLTGCFGQPPAPASISVATQTPAPTPAVEVLVEVTPTPTVAAPATLAPTAPITPTVAAPATLAPTAILVVASPTPAPQIIIVTATPAPATAEPTKAPAPAIATCTLPADEAGMPTYLASKFGGAANQWRQVVEETSGAKLCVWEFLAAARELGRGPNAVLTYSTSAMGAVHYGVRNAAGDNWEAAYLVGPGDFTIAQVGKRDAVAIDTATWIPDGATTEQIAARTPGAAPAARSTSAATINETQLETLTSGPARFWVWVAGTPGHWELNSGDTLVTLTLIADLPAGTYISFGKEEPAGSGKWVEARITRAGESTPPLNKASYVTP